MCGCIVESDTCSTYDTCMIIPLITYALNAIQSEFLSLPISISYSPIYISFRSVGIVTHYKQCSDRLKSRVSTRSSSPTEVKSLAES